MDKINQYLNESPTIFFIYKKKDKWELEYVTNNVKTIFGFTANDFLSKKVNYKESIHKDDFKGFQKEAKEILTYEKETYSFKPYRIVSKDGIHWVNQISKLIKNENGNIDQIYGYITDITTQIEIKQNLQNYINIVNNNVLISISNNKGIIIDCSDAFSKISGYTKDELIGNNHKILKHKDTDVYLHKELWKTIQQGLCWKGEHKNVAKDGSIFWVENTITPSFDEDGNIIKYTSIYIDITHKKEISELLITDYLTKIYNRRYFNDIFTLEFKRAKRHKYTFIFIIIDIDYFKEYNDNYGHHAGDNALIKVAACLKKSLNRPEDYCFRLGGEEFGVITSIIDLKGAICLGEKLLENILNLKIPHEHSKTSSYLSVSLGLKFVEINEDINYTQIYKVADEALYNAKDSGRNKLCVSK